MDSETGICLVCAFFDEDGGECRKYTPDPKHGWPVTTPRGWCGEWEEMPDTSTDDTEDWPLGRI